MAIAVRRLVTGLDVNGRSVLTSDEYVGEAAPGNVDLWRSGGGSLSDGATAGPFPFFPAAGETILRVVSLPPVPAGATRAAMEAAAHGFFSAFDAEACRSDTTRDPWMHKTPTLDYVMVLSGAVSLLLDVGDPVPIAPHEVVVQRGTNHNWVNTGREPAILLVAMIGAVATIV
jgi:hypothetical protein